MAFKAGKAIKSHKAESHESQLGRRDLGLNEKPVKAKFTHQKPFESHLKAIRRVVCQAGSDNPYLI
jgi:hypothetical protein